MESWYYKYMYGDCSKEKEEVIKQTDNFTKLKGNIFIKDEISKNIYIEILKSNQYKTNSFKCGFAYMIEYIKIRSYKK